MRFAFISTMRAWQWGGSEELWSRAAIQLKRSGHDVQASVGYWPRLSDKVMCWRSRASGLKPTLRMHEGLARRIWNKLSLSRRRSYGRLKRFNPDLVVISQGHNAGGFDWAKCAGSRQYLT